MKFDTIKLSELAAIQTGPFGSQLHKEDYVVHGTPIVTVEHLGSRKFTEQNLPCVSDKDKERLKKYVLKTGDIVFSRVGSVDRCSYVSAEYEGWMFSGRCLRVRPCEKLNPEYLYYFFLLEKTKQFVRNIATGATMPSINTKFMGEIPIRVPSLDAQNKIASILWMIDDKIELNKKINKNLGQRSMSETSSSPVISFGRSASRELARILDSFAVFLHCTIHWRNYILKLFLMDFFVRNI